MSSITNLETYRLQKQERRAIRQSYIDKLADLGKQIYPPNNPTYIHPIFNEAQSQDALLAEENKELILELTKLEEQQRLKIADFKQKFDEVKYLYLSKIRQISEQGKKFKEEHLAKMSNLELQYSSAVKKSSQIQSYNQKLESEMIQASRLSQKYLEQIEKQYAEKLKQFENVFEASSQKIKSVEEKMSYEELVEATLGNQELINDIKDSALKNGPEVDRIFDDYVQLLKAKQEILAELRENNKVKEKEVANSGILEGKLKHIVTKLGEERQLYLDQNRKMSAELMQIQTLLEKVMGSALQ